MKEQIINDVLRAMQGTLNNSQLRMLQETLSILLTTVSILPTDEDYTSKDPDNQELLSKFLDAKRVEGCSEKTIHYYENTLRKMFDELKKSMVQVTTDDLRTYLSDYRKRTNCSKGNIDNLRRIFSSFFSWLEDEDLILKSPVRRIH